MHVTDLSGVGPVMADRLERAGLGTIEAIAAASDDELTAVPGVGPSVAGRLREHAVALTSTAEGPKAHTPAELATSVRRLRRAIPDLAKSKKQSKALHRSTTRMAAWVDDLDRRKIRKRFVAETGRLHDEATQRTGSKKAAKRLRKHISKIETAVRNS